MIEERTCRTCKWWVRNDFGSGTRGCNCDGSLSECRINAPVCHEAQNSPHHQTGVWPLTRPDDFCGKYDDMDSGR